MTKALKSKSFNCVGCGLCEGVCPVKAISVVEFFKGSTPIINNDTCINCGLCVKACAVDRIQQEEDIKQSKEVYFAKSREPQIYEAAASGGAVSTILINLFLEKNIDAAIVAFYDTHANVYGDIIENSEDVLKHAGSYYHTSKQLLNVSKIKNYKSVVFVGLPCHIEMFNQYCKIQQLNNVYLTIGLFCTIGRQKKGFDWFVSRHCDLNIKKEQIFDYTPRFGKSKEVIIKSSKGQIQFKDEEYKYNTDFFYMNWKCTQCRKLFAVSSDISVGDAWHKITEAADGIKEKLALVSFNTQNGLDNKKYTEGLVLKQSDFPIYDLVASQTFGTGLKITPNRVLNQCLAALKYVRIFQNNKICFWFFCRIRGQLMLRLWKRGQKLMRSLERG